MTLIRHHFVQRLREEGVRHKVGVVDESGQCGVLDAEEPRGTKYTAERYCILSPLCTHSLLIKAWCPSPAAIFFSLKR